VDSEALPSMLCGDPLSKRSVTMADAGRAEGEVSKKSPLHVMGQIDEDFWRS
jgi:hypothetical protein